MATYTANKAKHFTMANNVMDTVTLSGDVAAVEIINRGSGTIYYRSDDVDPTVKGDDNFVLPPGTAATLRTPGKVTKVKLISDGATEASVTV